MLPRCSGVIRALAISRSLIIGGCLYGGGKASQYASNAPLGRRFKRVKLAS